jgi:hypothetical protein
VATERSEVPQIVDVEALPARRHGKHGWDLTPLIEKVRDREPHALENVRTEEDRKRWRRQLRASARRLEMSVITRYAPEEARLYFQGVAREP